MPHHLPSDSIHNHHSASCGNSSSDLVFDLRSVSQRFGEFQALKDITFQCQQGERIALVGSSGAGKSTLLQILSGALQPSQGSVYAWGQEIYQQRSRQRRRIQRQIGMIYQQLHLVDNLRVIHNVNAGHLGRWSLLKALVSLGFPLEIATARQALLQVGIPEKLFDRTDTLSGGQQQRVAIARVLIQDPLVVLADEPISSLDPELSREIMALLCELCTAKNRTLIVSLHDVQIAQTFCDRMIGLRHGQIVFDQPSHHVSPAMIEALYQSSQPASSCSGSL